MPENKNYETGEVGEIEAHISPANKSRGVYVPGGQANPEIVVDGTPVVLSATTASNGKLPENAAPTTQSQTTTDGDNKDEEKKGDDGDKKEEEKTDLEEADKKNGDGIGGMARMNGALKVIKNITAKVNKINRDQKNFQRQWKSMQRAFGTLWLNLQRLIKAVTGGGGGN